MAGLIGKIIRHIITGDIFSLVHEKIVCYAKSKYYTLRYCKSKKGGGGIIFHSSNIKLHINLQKNSNFIVGHKLILQSFLNAGGDINISIGQGGICAFENDFILGANIKISVSDNATLTFGGKNLESGSGITESCIIMCYKKITIGKDFICSWNTYITDCDWHSISIDGRNCSSYEDVVIGNHVWIGSNVIIGKGSVLEDNVIIGAFSKISNRTITGRGITAGTPPRLLKENVQWQRDL